jgi:CBS domain-containing membrane protein
MRAIPGHLDITPGDFKAIYRLAFHHVLERLSREVSATEIMTRDVVTVTPDTSAAEVAAALGQRGISGLPVVDANHKLLGIISEKDFLARLVVTEPRNFMSLVAGCLKTMGSVALPIKKAVARDIMNSPPITVAPETPVHTIAATLTAKGINGGRGPNHAGGSPAGQQPGPCASILNSGGEQSLHFDRRPGEANSPALPQNPRPVPPKGLREGT